MEGGGDLWEVEGRGKGWCRGIDGAHAHCHLSVVPTPRHGEVAHPVAAPAPLKSSCSFSDS